MKKNKLKPGTGWTQDKDTLVYKHTSGIFLNITDSGMMWVPSKKIFCDADEYPHNEISSHYIRVSGGNHKRGLMMWALAMSGETRDKT